MADEYKYHFKYKIDVILNESERRKRPRFAPGKVDVFCDDLSYADGIAFQTFLDQNVPKKYHSTAEGIILSKEEV